MGLFARIPGAATIFKERSDKGVEASFFNVGRAFLEISF